MLRDRFTLLTEKLVFANRVAILVIFALITAFMGYKAMSLRMEAGFVKLLPYKHPYMRTLIDYSAKFGGGNQIIVALMQKKGDIFTPEFFTTLHEASDEVFFLPGVDKSKVTSIFTPNVRFTEFVEDGFAGGNVIPAEFQPTPEWLEIARQNIIKSGELGRLVTFDFTGSLIRAELLDRDPITGKKLDYQQVSKDLEEKIRQRFENDNVSVHILGFAKSIGDIAEGARSVIAFFGIAFVVTGVLLWLYSGSIQLTLMPLLCSSVAVIWQLGTLSLFGFGIDPMSILVPFLIFAIAVSHSVQMVSGWIGEVLYGADEQDVHHPVVPVNARTLGVDGYSAARRTFRRLLIPGSIAVLCNILGFVTILMINIGIIQEMGITASIGVTIIILTNLLLLPILLSFINLPNIEQYRQKRVAAESKRDGLWRTLSKFATTAWSIPTLVIIAITTVMAHFYSQGLQVGDLHAGVSELREEARYNLDTKMVTSKFAIGVDVLSVIVETPKNACIDYDTMVAMDELHWFAQNLPGVQSVLSLSEAMKIVTGGNNEGSPRWETLMRNQYNLSGALRYMETSSGLMDAECTAMPLLIYTKDHKADTVETIVRALEKYDSGLPKEKFNPRLASANVGIIAATNQAVHAAQEPIMAYVHGAIALLVLLSFRSVMVTACLMIPLLYVSSLCYALMTYLNIGLKVNTLPVVALGIGIGVDYGIYLYSRMADFLNEGLGLQESLYRALKLTGKPVMFTAATLAVGVATWIFSDLKFQADMGILLTFMFIVNMIGAILVIPALARWLLPARLRNPSTPAG